MTQDTPRGDVTPITLDTGFAFFHAAAATMAFDAGDRPS
jgi:hypothetical protein